MNTPPWDSEPPKSPKSVTLNTIADKAGVHKSTVSLALRNHPRIPRDTCQRIQDLARQLGYRPNPYVKAVMSHLQAGRTPAFQGSLALIHTNPHTHKYFYSRAYVRGALGRANELGFKLTEFNLISEAYTPVQLRRMLLARNIHLLIIYHHPTAEIPGHQIPMDLSDFSVITIGSRLENPTYNFVGTDAFYAASLAVTNALKLGYRRIGLAMSGYVDYENEYRYSGGYDAALKTYGIKNEIPVCFIDREDYQKIEPWLRKYKPDVILGLNDEVPQAAIDSGYSIPETIGWIHLDWGPGLNHWTGINSMHEVVGRAAVDIVVAHFNRNERGAPEHPRSALVNGQWIEGQTVLKRSNPTVIQPRYKPLPRRKGVSARHIGSST